MRECQKWKYTKLDGKLKQTEKETQGEMSGAREREATSTSEVSILILNIS